MLTKLLRNLPQHAVGILGQLIAALPQVLVAIYLARRSGLETAGLFAVVTGLVAAAFTAAMWGFSPHIVLHRLRQFPAMSYLVARGLALLLMSIVVVAVCRVWFPEVGIALLLAVVGFRATDAVIDLHFGLAQVWRGPGEAINLYSALHAGKLAVLLVLLVVVETLAPFPPELTVLISAVVSFAGVVTLLLTRPRLRHGAVGASGQIARLFVETSWLAVAAVLCALVSNIPRINLPFMFDGDELGVAGIALTVSTFFGMAFYTTWVRHFSSMAADGRSRSTFAYLAEIALLGVIFAATAVWVLPKLASWIFAFDGLRFGAQMRNILVAAVVFFAGMSFANLYKLGHMQWMEGVVYLTASAVFMIPRVAGLQLATLSVLLVLTGVTMAALSIPAMFVRPAGTAHG